MRNLGQRYVQYFNRRYERSGTLWESRPHSCLVDSARYVLATYRDIERNPVRAGMVEVPALYPWSSHEANAGRVEDPALFPDEPQFLSEIREATHGGYPLLGEALKASLAVPRERLARKKPGPAPREEPASDDGVTADLSF